VPGPAAAPPRNSPEWLLRRARGPPAPRRLAACCDAWVTDPDDFLLLAAKNCHAASLFEPGNLLREARRQKNLPDLGVPAICLLDPDGDIVGHLAVTGRGR